MATTKRFIAKNGLDSNTNTITNVADPVNATDAVTKQFITDTYVSGKLLTNFAVGTNATVAASDSILGALGKVQGQLNNKQASGSYLTSEADTLASVTGRGNTTTNAISVGALTAGISGAGTPASFSSGGNTYINLVNGGARTYRIYSADTSNNGFNGFGIYDTTGSAFRLAIDSVGSIGIGTTAPSRSIVNIHAANKTLASTTSIFAITASDALAADIGGSMHFGAHYDATADFAPLGYIAGRRENATSGSFAGYLQFAVTGGGAGTIEAMRINSSGNVGIGTTAPNAQLEVGTNAAFTGSRIRSVGYGTSGSSTANLEIGDGNTVYWRFLRNNSNQFEMNMSSHLNINGGNMLLLNNVASTSTTTGTLIVTGGVGVSGNINAGGIQAAFVKAGTSTIDPSAFAGGAGLGSITATTGWSAPGIVFGPGSGSNSAIVAGAGTIYFGMETALNTMATKATLSSAGVFNAVGGLTSNGTITVAGSVNVTGSWAGITLGGKSFAYCDGTEHYLYSPGSGGFIFRNFADNATLMTLTNVGKIGIGITPTYYLDLTAPAIGSGRQGLVNLLHSGNNTFSIDAFGASSSVTPSTIQLSATNAEQNISIISDTSANAQAGGSTKGLFIKGNGGNVGIGKTSPLAKLDVMGELRISNTTATGGDYDNYPVRIVSYYDGNSMKIFGNAGNEYFGVYGYSKTVLGLAGNVGIGQTSPTYKLDVTGDIRATNYVYADVILLSPGLQGTGSQDLGLTRPGAYSILFNTNGSERMRVDSVGNLGIGTTTPQGPLHVHVTGGSADMIGGSILLSRFYNGTFRAGSIFNYYGAAAGQDLLAFGVSSDTTPTDIAKAKMVIGTSGNVGIGTTAPTNRLAVQGGSIGLWGTNRLYFYSDAGSSSHGSINDDGNFHIDSYASPMWLNSATGYSINLNGQNGNNVCLGAGGGSVGINTASPSSSYKLDVVGDTRTGTITTSNIWINSGASFSGLNIPDMVPLVFQKDFQQDMFAFNAPTTYETYNGSTWTSTTVPTGIFTGRASNAWSGLSIPQSVTQVRFTWPTFNYRYWDMLTLVHSTNGNSFTATLQWSTDGVTWTSYWTTPSYSSWPGYSTFRSSGNNSGQTPQLRLILTCTQNNANTINIGHIGLMGTYGGFNRLYDWDYARNITTYGNISVNSGNGSIYTGDLYAASWLRLSGAKTGLYHSGYNTHFYANDASYWRVSSNYGMMFNSTTVHDSTPVGQVYHDGGGFGLMNDQGGWSVKCLQGASYGGALTGNWALSSGTTGSTATPTSLSLPSNFSNGYTRDKLKLYLYNSGTEQYGFTTGPASDIQHHSNGTHDFYVANTKIVSINSTTFSTPGSISLTNANGHAISFDYSSWTRNAVLSLENTFDLLIQGHSNINFRTDHLNGVTTNRLGISTTAITISLPLNGTYAPSSSYNSSTGLLATPTGLRTQSSFLHFTDNASFAPYTMYRTSGDQPAPYGIGWATGGESAGIFVQYAANGYSLGEMVSYVNNDGYGAFAWVNGNWEGAAYVAAGSNNYTKRIMTLSAGGNLVTSGPISASNFSGSSSGTNTGDQTLPTLSSLGGQAALNGTGFVKASGTTISYDNTSYAASKSWTGYAYEATYDLNSLQVTNEPHFLQPSTINAPSGASGMCYTWMTAGGDTASRGIQFYAETTRMFWRERSNNTWREFVLSGSALGTPLSGTLTNCTFPTLNQNTTGTSGGLTGTPNITVGSIAATSFNDGYITWTAAQINRPGSNVELQFGATASSTVKIGGGGSNPTTFNANTGIVTHVGSQGSDVSIVQITNNGNANYMQGFQLLTPNLSVGYHAVGLGVGKVWSAYNAAYIGFYYAGLGSTVNYLTLGGHSCDDILILRMDGRVGIGTTSPGYKLHVVGQVGIGQNTNGTAVIDAYGGFAYYGCDTVGNGIRVNSAGNVNTTGTITQNGTAVVLTNDARMSDARAANGGTSAACSGNAATATRASTVAVNTGRTDNNNFQILGSYANSNPGDIYSTGNIYFNASSNTIYATDFSASSDIRLKTNILVIPEALNKIKQLHGITYNWNELSQKDQTVRQAGVIAQDVQKVLPEAVHETDGFLSVSYNKLVPLLIEGMKEQQLKIEELERRLNDNS